LKSKRSEKSVCSVANPVATQTKLRDTVVCRQNLQLCHKTYGNTLFLWLSLSRPKKIENYCAIQMSQNIDLIAGQLPDFVIKM
jgi:hypothetical protein